MKKNQIPPSAERQLFRLEREYENGSIPEKDYEIRKREILARASGIPQGHTDTHRIKKQKIRKQKIQKPAKDSSFIKNAFPFILIGLLLIGLSFKIIPELGQKGSVIVSTIEKSVPKEIIPSLNQDNSQAGNQNSEPYSPPNIPQISVPPPVSSTSTIETPTSTITQTSTIIDDYISQDKATHAFTVPEANSIIYKVQSELKINVPRSMSFGTPSIYGGEGIINTSVVRGGYYLFSDRPPKDSNTMITIFVIEPGKEDTFFKELDRYMSSFESAYNINSTLYEKVDGPKLTSSPSIQYQFKFYPAGDKSFQSNVRLTAIKKSNLIVYIYHLDNLGLFSSQIDNEKKIISILNSYK
mgnify:CR=1 FL=1